MYRKLSILATVALVSGLVHSQDAGVNTSSGREYFASQDGQMIYDKKTGLVWMRCSIGQTWDGKSCLGSPRDHSFSGAMQAPSQVNAIGFGGYRDWTLPNIVQLVSLRYCSKGEYVGNDLRPIRASVFGVEMPRACSGGVSPAIDPVVFPNTIAGSYRTSSKNPADDFHTGIRIDFRRGYIDTNSLDDQGGSVRLVRKNPISSDEAAQAFPVDYASLSQTFEVLARDKQQIENEAKELKAKQEAEQRQVAAKREEEQRAQAAKAEAEFKTMFPRLGRCIVGESVTHRELLNASQSSGNALADIIWNSHTKAQYVIEYEAVVEGFVGSKVKTTINGYQVKQLKAGSYVDGADMRSRVAGYADKMVGKTQFYDRARCSK
ncbi:Lcl domain-containing protein [Limnohabitans radicicola]|uniref:DUF1566 domain-containing protein n=1 Tax=Limnohabitans radicicola TaxID=2771427 RepID=A0A927FJN2_9BURK|nr:DUF1566 domain-containing protein [Limnohabitans radicicola]